MTMHAALQVENVTKLYSRDHKQSVRAGLLDMVRELALLAPRAEPRQEGEFLALDRVSFQLLPGQALGIVGRNGAGKSTLLKLISNLVRPSAGSIMVSGRVAALIELGAGFHPLLSGRENIRFFASMLGIPDAAISREFDNIVEFADVGAFIDAPLRVYSSGMRARLGFSVAVHFAPGIFLVDEALAVGDAAFRAKCYRKISELLENGTALVLVSHNPQLLLATCTRGLLLEGGRVSYDGTIQEALRRYEASLLPPGSGPVLSRWQESANADSTSRELRITSIFLRDAEERIINALRTGEPGMICVRCVAKRAFAALSMGAIIRFLNAGSEPFLFMSARLDKHEFSVPVGESELRLRFLPTGLRSGLYSAKITVQAPPFATLDCVERVDFLVQSEADIGASMYFQPHSWETRIVAVQEAENAPEPT